MHDTTCFAVFIPRLSKDDVIQANVLFEDAFMKALLKAGAKRHYIENACSLFARLQFDNLKNRSLPGTMHPIKQPLEHITYVDNVKTS